MKNSYKPETVTLASVAATGLPYVQKDASLSKWELLLLAGIAKNISNSVIADGAVALWMATDNAGTISEADYITFTDDDGNYGVTIPAGEKFVIKFYS